MVGWHQKLWSIFNLKQSILSQNGISLNPLGMAGTVLDFFSITSLTWRRNHFQSKSPHCFCSSITVAFSCGWCCCPSPLFPWDCWPSPGLPCVRRDRSTSVVAGRNFPDCFILFAALCSISVTSLQFLVFLSAPSWFSEIYFTMPFQHFDNELSRYNMLCIYPACGHWAS